MRRLALLGATVVLTAMLAVTPYAANAAHQTVTKPAVVLNPHRTDWVQALSVEKFDTSLGALVSVTVKYSYGLEGFVKYENLNAQGQDITFVVNGSTGLRWAGGANVAAPIAYHWDKTMSVQARDAGGLDWAGEAGGLAANLSDSANWAPVTLTGAAINDFKGPGNVNFEAFSAFKSETISSGSVATWYQTDTSARVEVSYEYEAVPEPGGLLAIFSGLVGMVGTVLKRRS